MTHLIFEFCEYLLYIDNLHVRQLHKVHAQVVMFDSPPAIFLRERKVQPVVYESRQMDGKEVQKCVLALQPEDWVVFVSDGVLNAGIGGLYPLGWGWEQAASFIEQKAHADLTAQDLADRIADAVNELYAGRVGDDVSIVTVKARRKHTLTVMTGPPSKRSMNEEVVAEFLKRGGRLAVCGGTTAQIVARHLGRPVEVDLGTMTEDVPPVARIEGIGLVTEGILTLTQVSEILRSGADRSTVRFRTDGAASLIRELLDADHIHFVVGEAVNPAHQNPELPHRLGIRQAVVRDIADELRKRGREVTIESV